VAMADVDMALRAEFDELFGPLHGVQEREKFAGLA
jgi:hypothetical protein